MTELRKYLRSKGYSSFEGSVYNQREQEQLLRSLIKGKSKGLEIGFNAGDSANIFLSENCELTSCDIFRHQYCYDAVDFLKNKYPDKLTIIKGNSTETLPEIENKYDFIYVDGNHTYEVVKQDLNNIVSLCHKDTLLIIDDYVLNPDFIRPHNEGVIQGVAEFEEFEPIDFKEFGRGRGVIWGKLNVEI